MTFFTDPAFFVLLVLAAIPAAILGFLGRSQRFYLLGVSLLFLAFLFSKTPLAGLAFVFYLALSFSVSRLFLYLRSSRPSQSLQAPPSLPGRADLGSDTPGRYGDDRPQASPNLLGPSYPAGSKPPAIPGIAKSSRTRNGFSPSEPAGSKPPAIPEMALFLVVVGILLLPLVAYKASALFDASLLGFLGISYITFKTVQVAIEIHDGLIKELGIVDYLAFLVFFPPFTAGPIMRSRDFMHDIRTVPQQSDYRELFTRGLLWFLIGVFYKMVCSAVFSIAIWYLPKALGNASWVAIVAGQIGSAYAYGFYLFFDFAGYSLMAIGIGAVFGIKVPRNFHYPFASIDIKDFWNRWHMSLSFWLRDYVFMRFVRTVRRHRLIGSRVATSCCGYLLNMGLMGLWHGVTLNYLAYGLYHGLLLASHELFQRTSFFKRHKDTKPYRIVSWLVTFNLVMLGFAIFSGQVSLSGH
ncbi:MAG: D-alanyl-lipoteichoic acid biosynthesis protein DltB [Coriobacteriaceae bacterium]|jgi:membrane protein involved in D-alanine export|nr:D-alanyl-lipoteichoic acid biosynthesis protein DltB [Coriobacteriaceae bacterium]